MSWLRRRVAVLALGIVALIPSAGRADPPAVAALGTGDSVFWNGPLVEDAGTGSRQADPLICQGIAANLATCLALRNAGSAISILSGNASQTCEAPGCFEYMLDVVEYAGRLRVALDHPDIRDVFEVSLYDPAAVWVSGTTSGNYSIEPFAEHPATGRWTIRVVLHDVENSAFRMRAVLEDPPAPPATAVALMPNLKATPPFDLVFGGCQASEIAQYNSRRCLRFSAGPANAGDGPLDLRIDSLAQSGVNWQWIHYSDGSFRVRPAGTFVWHTEHLHYHHVGTGEYRLYRVVDEQSGELAPTGQGPKIGFCMGDYLIAEWDSFAQDPQFSGSGSCLGVDAPLGTKMGLTRGWGDIYTYDTEGNYVDFGDNTDGLYVIRVATDPDDDIAELDEDDNHGYAYIRVTGEQIEVLERGYGMSPWDPARTVSADLRRPTAEPSSL